MYQQVPGILYTSNGFRTSDHREESKISELEAPV